MAKNKIPNWLRALDVIAGTIAIVLSVIVIIFPLVAIETLILILVTSLLILGISRVIFYIAAEHLSKGLRALGILVGLLSIVLATLSIVYPGLGAVTLIYYLAFALMFNGIASISIFGITKILPYALRVVSGVIGLLTMFFAVLILVFPGLGAATLVLLLSFTFMLNGIHILISGITGAEY